MNVSEARHNVKRKSRHGWETKDAEVNLVFLPPLSAHLKQPYCTFSVVISGKELFLRATFAVDSAECTRISRGKKNHLFIAVHFLSLFHSEVTHTVKDISMAEKKLRKQIKVLFRKPCNAAELLRSFALLLTGFSKRLVKHRRTAGL